MTPPSTTDSVIEVDIRTSKANFFFSFRNGDCWQLVRELNTDQLPNEEHSTQAWFNQHFHKPLAEVEGPCEEARDLISVHFRFRRKWPHTRTLFCLFCVKSPLFLRQPLLSCSWVLRTHIFYKVFFLSLLISKALAR